LEASQQEYPRKPRKQGGVLPTALESQSIIVGGADHLVWEPPGPGTWTRDPSKQPRPPTGFFKALVPTILNDAFREVGPRYGLLLEGFQIADVNGWLFVRPSPFGAPDKAGPPPPRFVMRLLLALHPGLRARRKAAARALADRLWLQDGREWLDGGRDAFVARLREFTTEDPRRLSREELRLHFAAVTDLFRRGNRIHFRDAIGHYLSIGDFARQASAWTGVAPDEVVNVFAGSSPFSLAPLEHLDRIVEALNKDPDTRQRFLDQAVPAADRLTALRSASPEAAAALDEYLFEYGNRSVMGFDFDEKSIADMPEALVASIAARLNHPVVIQPQTSDWLRPRVPDEHLAAYDVLKAEAEVLYGVRENDAGAFEWASGLVRRALAVIGELLAEEGALLRPGHIVDAFPEEVDAMLRRAPGAPSADEMAERQRRRLNAPTDPPLILGDAQDPPSFEWLPGALGRINNAIMLGMSFDGGLGADAERRNPAAAMELAGVAASRGVYRGQARVVTTPTDFGRLVQGDVLVAAMTTPAYNVLLPLLGAVVTDTGGVLSHAAIVAREYQIPAVVATGTATTSIPDGSLITVDGDRGVVTVEG
jgi:pyruvate,water dikinase